MNKIVSVRGIKMEIISTIGSSCKGNEFENIIKCAAEVGLDYFRFNFSKYRDIEDIYKHTEVICSLKDKYNIKIMLDIPYPYRKPRIYLKFGQKEVKKHDKFMISVGCSRETEVYTDCKKIMDLDIGTMIVYSDGDGLLEVMDKKRNGIVVVAKTSCVLINAKSISFGQFIFNESIQDLKVAIQTIKPNSVALSFVSSKNDVVKFIDGINVNTEIISKIENQEGLDNIDKILLVSNVMIARGDLYINTDFRMLAEYQSRIFEMAKKRNREVYVATGILSSLYNRCIPTQSDLTDVSNIIANRPKGVILNYGVVMSNISIAAEIIDFIDKRCL